MVSGAGYRKAEFASVIKRAVIVTTTTTKTPSNDTNSIESQQEPKRKTPYRRKTHRAPANSRKLSVEGSGYCRRTVLVVGNYGRAGTCP